MGEESGDTSAWDGTVQEWLVDSGKVWGGAVANVSTGCRFFGAATDQPEHPDGPWGAIAKSGYTIEVTQEDGSTKSEDCDESETIRQAVVDGKAPNGVYIGGTKYTLAEVKREFDESQPYDIALLTKNKGGGFLIKTPNGTVAVALYDEEKGQNKVDAFNTALAFADFLYNGGF
ncbi:hypothetical protein ACSSS7_007257 [Eimeria intestinalis]